MSFSTFAFQGWGMTETGICFLQEASDSTKGTLGGPLAHCEFKVVSLPDLRYSAASETPKSVGQSFLGDFLEIVNANGLDLIFFEEKCFVSKSTNFKTKHFVLRRGLLPISADVRLRYPPSLTFLERHIVCPAGSAHVRGSFGNSSWEGAFANS